MKLSLNMKILIGAVLGLITGFVLSQTGTDGPVTSSIFYALSVLANCFVALLKMILIPLVFTSITVGIANLRSHHQMGKVWQFSLLYYFSTTAIAVALGILVINIFKPGVGLEISMFKDAMGENAIQGITLKEFFENFLSNLFVNPFEAMANGQVIGTIVFAAFLGVALVLAGDARAKTILGLLTEFFDLIMMIVGWIMNLLPIGIFALLAKLVATQDPSLFAALGKYMVVVTAVTLFHGFVVLPGILFLITKRRPLKFLSGMREALVTAFSTSSSSATLPVTYRCVKERLNVNKDVAGFVLPLGATINMDGTALYEAVAALFVANLAGIDLNLVQQFTVFLMAIVASVGAPGIPSAGLVTIVMVLQSVGLPVEAIAILIPIDRLLDATRTMVNVNGDAVGAVVVDKLTR